MKARLRLSVELGEIKQRWDDWCVQRDITSSEAARRLIIDVLGADDGESAVEGADLMRWTPVGEPRERLEIRLTISELQALRHQAAAGGFSANSWVVALVRAQLAHEPQFGEQEMALLATSNQSLAVISRSLGALLRDVRRQNIQDDGVSGRWMAEMKAQIDVHLRAVADLVRANIDRWSR